MLMSSLPMTLEHRMQARIVALTVLLSAVATEALLLNWTLALDLMTRGAVALTVRIRNMGLTLDRTLSMTQKQLALTLKPLISMSHALRRTNWVT